MQTTAMLCVAAPALTPGMAFAQSNDQLRAYQNFERAKAAHKTPQALDYGQAWVNCAVFAQGRSK